MPGSIPCAMEHKPTKTHIDAASIRQLVREFRARGSYLRRSNPEIIRNPAALMR